MNLMNFNLNAVNFNAVGTEVIVLVKTWGGEGLNWMGSQVNVILGNTGLYKTSIWGVVAAFWAKIAPTMGALWNFLGTGYGIGFVFLAAPTAYFGYYAIKAALHAEIFSFIKNAILAIAFGAFFLIALTHGAVAIV